MARQRRHRRLRQRARLGAGGGARSAARQGQHRHGRRAGRGAAEDHPGCGRRPVAEVQPRGPARGQEAEGRSERRCHRAVGLNTRPRRRAQGGRRRAGRCRDRDARERRRPQGDARTAQGGRRHVGRDHGHRRRRCQDAGRGDHQEDGGLGIQAAVRQGREPVEAPRRSRRGQLGTSATPAPRLAFLVEISTTLKDPGSPCLRTASGNAFRRGAHSTVIPAAARQREAPGPRGQGCARSPGSRIGAAHRPG